MENFLNGKRKEISIVMAIARVEVIAFVIVMMLRKRCNREDLTWIRLLPLERELSLIRQCKKGPPKTQMPQPVPPLHNLGAQNKDQKVLSVSLLSLSLRHSLELPNVVFNFL